MTMRIDIYRDPLDGQCSLLINGVESGAVIRIEVGLDKDPTVTINGGEIKAKVYLDERIFVDTTRLPLTKMMMGTPWL